MDKIYIIFFSFFIFNSTFSQIKGPRITALGNTGVALQDVWSSKSNQAGLMGMEAAVFSAGYENRFSIRELSTQSAVAAIPLKNIVLGASFQRYGNNEYSDIKTGLSLAKSFGPKLYLALTVNYNQLKIENYTNENAITVDVGLQYQALPNLWLGAHIENPNQNKFDNLEDQILPTHIQFGVSYLFTDKVLLSTEIEKILENQLDFKTGLEYNIAKILALRGGISANPFKQYAGFGLDYKQVKLDFAISSHPVLGYSPQIALGYEF